MGEWGGWEVEEEVLRDRGKRRRGEGGRRGVWSGLWYGGVCRALR